MTDLSTLVLTAHGIGLFVIFVLAFRLPERVILIALAVQTVVALATLAAIFPGAGG